MSTTCPKCHTDNPDDSKFCKECATPFPGAGGAVPTKTLETPLKGLAEGSTVAGKYKIIEVLGKGGMGIVYKAEDTKLKRTVALKFLSPELTRNSEAKERFILEAQAASALDHNNICTVHEIDESEGQMFIAMAYVEGQSLRERIIQGPLKLEEALDIAAQISAGLHEAHEKGIVHRDIKSSNIMITSKGQAMIMDFGIAKLSGETKITQTGTTMGTVAYMSPEQARGEKVDHKADIWSLGVVLYEMVIGQLPFKGDHEQAVMYSILNENPEPMTALRTGVPMELERIVSKSLQKDPAIRYQHTDDMLVDLRFLKENLTAFFKSPVVPGPTLTKLQAKPWKRVLPWGLFCLMTIASAILLWLWIRPTTSTRSNVSRFFLKIPYDQQYIPSFGQDIILSPDGRSFVYVGQGELDRQLLVRKMDQLDASPIPGTEGASSPFFSPDSQWVGYFSGVKLKKVSLMGGPPLTISDVSSPSGGTWDQNGMIIFGTNSSGLFQVSSTGGVPQSITTPDAEQGVTSHRWPDILPGDDAVLVTIWKSNMEDVSIGVANLKTGKVKSLMDMGTYPRYALTGHLVYGSPDGLLLAAPFDLSRLEVKGSVISLLDGIHITSDGPLYFTLSHNGSLVYLKGESLNYSVVMVDRQGIEQSLGKEQRTFRSPRFSPDGKQVAFGIRDGSSLDIWIFKLDYGPMTRLTFGTRDIYPTWTPDGERIVFSSGRTGDPDLYWKKADGSSDVELLFKAESPQYETSLSLDGKLLAYRETHPSTGMDIHVLPLEGERKPQPFLNTSFREVTPMLSPNGRWLAYASNESGRSEIYVRIFPDVGGGRWQVSTEGGQEPLWSRDGRELFYRSYDKKIVSVAVDIEPEFELGTRKILFEDVYVKRYQHSNYDIHPNNDRFVMVKPRDMQSVEMIVVLDWFEELKRLVPTEK